MTDPAPPSSSTASPPPPPLLRATLCVGAACVLLGALGWAWELLARQAPASPWRVAGFPAFVDRLALHAWIEGLAIFALAPRALAALAPRRARAAFVALLAGTALALGALAYSAVTGLPGAQIRDTGQAGHGVLVARLTGELALLAVLLLALWSAVATPRRDA